MALAKSMGPVEKVADRNKTDAAYRAGSPTTVTRNESDVQMQPTFYGTYVAEED